MTFLLLVRLYLRNFISIILQEIHAEMRELKKTIKKTIKGRLSSQEEGLVTLERKQGNVCFSMCYQILTISSFNIFMVLFLPWTNQI